MTFLEKFEEIKKVSDVDVKFEKDFAIQINLTDEDCGGAFYVEHRNGVVNVEPYDYNDRDAMMTIDSELLIKTLTGEADSIAAFFAGKFTIDGNVEAVLELTKIADAVKAKKKAEEAEKKAAEKAAKEAKKAEEKAKKEAEKKAKAEKEKAAKEAEKKAKAEAEKKAKEEAEKAKKEAEKKEAKKAPAKKAEKEEKKPATKKTATKKAEKQMKLDI